MFGLSGCGFRFGNVVGPRQTHGVGFDFRPSPARRTRASCEILGDGTQSKSYIHVDRRRGGRAPRGSAVSEAGGRLQRRDRRLHHRPEIAELACECLGLDPGKTRLSFGTGNGGWKGDVPWCVSTTDRIRSLGWRCRRSTGEALEASLMEMLPDLRAGRA